VEQGDVDVGGVGLDHPRRDPLRAQHRADAPGLLAVDQPDGRHQPGAGRRQPLERGDLVGPADRQHRPAREVRPGLEAGPAGERQRDVERAAVVLQVLRRRPPGRVVGELLFGLQEHDAGAALGQVRGRRGPGDPPTDDDDVDGHPCR
jgi:hypothetical protein